MKKAKYYILALLLPLLLCIIILWTKGILSNIEYFFITDLRAQHLPFLNYMKNILLGNTSIHYSFSAGLGNSMLATMIFYAISPINLLLVLVNNVQYSILCIYITKICLASLTMFILLKSKTKKASLTTVIFSTCYAICAFTINYFFCIFWLDALYLAPLVMYGIDKIVEKEKISLVYILSLALTIICNIQMGFSLCIFSLIYFIYSFTMKYTIKENKEKLKQISIIFIISSICSIAISSGVLLGFISEYSKILAARQSNEIEVFTTNIAYALKNLFTIGNLKQDQHYYNNLEPYIYSGLIVSFFSMIYLFGSKEKTEKRSPALIVILIFIISFSIKTINIFWHLTNPILLNYRYSIYLTAFLTMIAYISYCEKEKLTSKDIKVLIISLFVAAFIILSFSKEVYVIYTLIFIILISAGIYLTKNKSKKFEILLLSIVIIEIIINANMSIYGANEIQTGVYTSYKDLTKFANKNKLEDDYRLINNNTYTEYSNDSILLNQNSSSRYFSSVINGNIIKFFERNLAKVGNNVYQTSAYESPLLLSLLGNKYFYLTEDFNNGIYEKKDTQKTKEYNYKTGDINKKEIYLYENPYALTLGYIINKDSKYLKKYDMIDYQNQIIKDFSGIDEDVIIKLKYQKEEDNELCKEEADGKCTKYKITNDTNNKIVSVYGKWDNLQVKNEIQNHSDIDKPLIMTSLDDDLEITSQVFNGTDYDYTFTTYDEEKMIKALTSLQQNMLKNIKIDKNTMTGNIDAKKNGILFLSIPYEKNFTIYVDGKKTKHFSLLDKTFTGLNIKEGNHKIKITYKNNNLKWYVIISLASLIITYIITSKINKKIDLKKQIEKQKRELEEHNKKIKQEKKKEIKKNKKNKEKIKYSKKSKKGK